MPELPPLPPLGGLWHLALNVRDVERAVGFYTQVVGLQVEWRPDPDNVYLTSGADNLAIHKAAEVNTPGALDHLGFVLLEPEHVDLWAERVRAAGYPLEQEPKTHRDGARSFYVRDPEGNLVQFIHHPPISPRAAALRSLP